MGQSGGQTDVTLTTAEMASHSHTATASSDVAATTVTAPGASSILGAIQSGFFPKIYSDRSGNGFGLDSVIQDRGGGQAHGNEQPYLAINYLIYFLPQRPAAGLVEDGLVTHALVARADRHQENLLAAHHRVVELIGPLI